MTGIHRDIDTLRLEVVDLRADLRALRQDLARRKRAVAREMKPKVTKISTAREREQELELLVHEDSEVCRLEDEILVIQRKEERGVAVLENANREGQAGQWLVRERMADALSEVATCIARTPLGHLVLMMTQSFGSKSAYTGEAPYMWEREIE